MLRSMTDAADGTAGRATSSLPRIGGHSFVLLLGFAGAATVGVSVFHHWLGGRGAVMQGYFFVAHSEFYAARTVLAAPLGIALVLVTARLFGRLESERYDRARSALLTLTGLASVGYPVWLWVLANRRSELVTWDPRLAFYTTVAGGVLLVVAGGSLLKRANERSAANGRADRDAARADTDP